MKKYFFIRFGLDFINEVTEELANFVEPGNSKLLCLPGCFITIFNSTESLENIHDALSKIQCYELPIVFFLIDISNTNNIELNFPGELGLLIRDHIGIGGKKDITNLSIKELQKLLEDFIANENYIDAAKIRDRIKHLNS